MATVTIVPQTNAQYDRLPQIAALYCRHGRLLQNIADYHRLITDYRELLHKAAD